MTFPIVADSTQPTPRRHADRRSVAPTLAVLAGAAVAAIAIGAALGPQLQTVSAAQTGNQHLVDRIRALPGTLDGFRSLSIAEVGPDGAVFAGLGDADPANLGAPAPDTVFELGSITKTFTGALFADAIERGEVAADDELSEYLTTLEGTPAGAATLASLSQHSSGLPGLGATAAAGTLSSIILNENAYASTTTEQLISDAAVAPVDPDQGVVYSNFAVSLLGTALVAAAGADDYASLLEERLTGPLGMDHTVVAATADEVPADAVPGFLLNGTPAPRWWGEGYLPAGASTFTTASDLAIWARANLDGTAPGAAALDPTAPMGAEAQIGWGWITSPSFDGTGTQTWHNGGTGGFRSILVLDHEADTAFIALSNTVATVDDVAVSYARGTPLPGVPESNLILGWSIAALALALGAVALIRALFAKSLLPSVSDLTWAAAGLLLLWNSGPWFTVGGWVWGLAFAPSLAAVGVLVARTARGHRTPFLPARRVWFWWTTAVVGLAATVGISFLW